MLNTIFSSVFTETTAAFTLVSSLPRTAVSLILGLLIAAVYRYKAECTKALAVTLVLMPVIVQMVIMLVNGNLEPESPLPEFSLVRFRSAPEVPKKSAASFLLWQWAAFATGMGFSWNRSICNYCRGAVWFILVQTNFGEKKEKKLALPFRVP